ncbi:MAG: MBL fold metallo-hydrolase [Candidatus Eisenbacteria bacterium]|nr:MBL fold metallo-hydrolase [Candidatus Eisenbacteria bacterium]
MLRRSCRTTRRRRPRIPNRERSVEIGPYHIQTLIGSRFGLDGGAMFGSVPRAVWTREIDPDAGNRIPLVARPLVVRGEGRLILVDTGCGHRFSPKAREQLAIDPGVDLGGALRAAGIEPREVTHVVLTHLHFDHSGGLFAGTEEEPQPLFPQAKILVQRENWERARDPGPKERASYRPQELQPLADCDLELLDGPGEPFPGIRVRVTDGHTRGHQTVEIEGGDAWLLYAGDLVPTVSHLRSAFTMGYDMRAEEVIRDKEELLEACRARDGILVFDHDPRLAACRVGRTAKGFHARRKFEL